MKILQTGYRRVWNSVGMFSPEARKIGVSKRSALAALKTLDLAAVPFRPNGNYLENLRIEIINVGNGRHPNARWSSNIDVEYFRRDKQTTASNAPLWAPDVDVQYFSNTRKKESARELIEAVSNLAETGFSEEFKKTCALFDKLISVFSPKVKKYAARPARYMAINNQIIMSILTTITYARLFIKSLNGK